MTNDELLHKWVNGEISDAELAIFKQRPEFTSLTALYEKTEGLAAPIFNEKKMLTDVLQEEKNAQPVGRRVQMTSWLRYAAAASILLFAVWFLWPTDNTVTFTAELGEQTMGMLPDQSMFTLNAGSTLSYDSEDWKIERNLHLEGEAFFEVEEGEKFQINTANGVVKVLGTQFNVRDRAGQMEVQCFTGKVCVSSVAGKEFGVLLPQDILTVKGENVLAKGKLSEKNAAGWTTGIIRLKDTKLVEVLAELERQFKVNINPQEVEIQTTVSCNFQNEDLELALKTTLQPLQIKYTIKENNEIYLSK